MYADNNKGKGNYLAFLNYAQETSMSVYHVHGIVEDNMSDNVDS